MRAVLTICADLLREALSRKWILALALGITGVLTLLGFTLRMEVVDGALAATRLFGKAVRTDIRSVDVALRPLFGAASYLIFYGGCLFGVVACADFAPSLLSPGRIEHLLSLPIRRWQLLAGTLLGVLVLAACGALYGAGGLVLILGLKTGAWTIGPIIAALLAVVGFSAVYACMLTAAVISRSAALSAATGFVVMLLGIVAGYRDRLAPLFEEGFGRQAFRGLTALMPRLSTLANAANDFATSDAVAPGALARMLVGVAIFGLGALAVGIWRFENKDY